MLMFDKMKYLIPFQTNLKARKNCDFFIVMNNFGQVYYLNSTASFIYENCNNNNSIENIFNMMKKEFKILSDMEEELKFDIINTIRDFQWQKIIDLKKISS